MMAYTDTKIDYSKIKSSTLEFVTSGGTWGNPNGQSFQKYTLHLANGEKPEFLAKNQSTIERFKEGLKADVKPIISYLYKKEGQNFAALAPKDYIPPTQNNEMANNQKPAPTFNTQKQPPMTQQESIARSVAWNNVSGFVFTDEFQKYDDPTAKNADGQKILLSERQIKMLDQAIVAADLIYKQLLTKPK